MKSKASSARMVPATLLAAAVSAVAVALALSGGASANAPMTPPTNTAPPAISGQPLLGGTLTTSSGSWSGTTPTSYTVRWLRCNSAGAACAPIAGATNTAYVVGTADVGRRIRSEVTATNADGSATAVSAPTDVVVAASAPRNTALPVISGSVRVGRTITATRGTWTGSPTPTFRFQWGRCDTNGGNCALIAGAPGQSYTLVAADAGRRMRVRVIATNSRGSAEAVSVPTGVVGAAPANTTPPSLTGAGAEGQPLTAVRGNWTGTGTLTYSYQWLRCDANGNACGPIPGATAVTYVPVAADVGRRLRVQVTAANDVGRSTATSGASGVIAPKAPPLPPGAVKLPSGETSIPASSVSAPERLVISGIAYEPRVIQARGGVVTARFRVTDTRRYVVRDALVLVTPLPYVWATAPREVTSGMDGWASVQFRTRASIPKKSAIVVFVRARKAGGSVLAGVSTRRLTQVLVNAR